MQSPGYRSPPASASLISWCGGTLLAIDPATGTLRWERRLDLQLQRLLLAERLVAFAAYGGTSGSIVYMFDRTTGADRAQIEVGFHVSTAIRHGELLLFAGVRGILALRTDGSIAWRVRDEVVKSSAWSGDTYDLVARDAAGTERWRLLQRSMNHESALAIDDQVAQPDFS